MNDGNHPISLLLAHLYDVVHVGQEAVQANFQEHDERPAHVLSHLGLLVCRQSKQVLRGGAGESKATKG